MSTVPDNNLAALKAAADTTYKAATTTPSDSSSVHPMHVPEWWSNQNAMTMSAAVLLFGVLVLGLATYLMTIGRPGQSVLRIYGTILVIVTVTFLVVAGYDGPQIAAPIGLLGTIVGYLLGKDHREVDAKKDPHGDPPRTGK